MKTLLLTSAGMRVKEEILKILPKPPAEVKIAYVITATKGMGEYNESKDTDIKPMRELGFQIFYVDIESKTETELQDLFRDKDIIYVQGGNAFYLLKCVKEGGFDKVVKELINNGVIYIGVSAGSYIACPTIEVATWKHQDRNIVGLTDLTAMNLVPFLLTVHYKSEYRDLLKEVIAKSQYPVKILTDDQALLVRNGKVRLVGKGQEVRI